MTGEMSLGRAMLSPSGGAMCILCACCTTAFPPFWGNEKYVGPAAIVNDAEGVWRCRTVFNCTSACPRDIHVTGTIQEVKHAMLTGSLDAEKPTGLASPAVDGQPDAGSGIGENPG